MRSAKNLVTEVEKAPNIMVENMNVYIKAEIRNGTCVCGMNTWIKKRVIEDMIQGPALTFAE